VLTSSAADGDTQKFTYQQAIVSHTVTSATAGFITACEHLTTITSAHGKVPGPSATGDDDH